MSIDASAINEIFDMFPTDDPNPSEVLDELKQVKKLLEEWEEADDYIDTPDELSMLVSGLREDYDEAEDRIEHLENYASRLEEKVEECKDITMDDLTTAEKEGDETLEEYVKRRIDKYILEGSLFTSDHMVEYEERMDEIKADRRELQDHMVEYEESIRRGNVFIRRLEDENEELKRSLQFVRNTLTEPIQEAVPPS